jgi:alkylation response protein AidB-like acyl-CoA dehydrogenase
MAELSRGVEVLDFRTIEVTPEERGFMLLAQQLSYETFGPRAARYDGENAFPRENFEDLRQCGYLGLRVPKTFGGMGVSSLAFAATTVELAKGDPATALCFATHSTVMTLVEQLAAREQQEHYFGLAVAEGKKFGACVLEPDWNLFSGELPKTTLTPAPGGYLLRGRKAYCSFGEAADVLFVSALLGGDVLGLFVPPGAPNVRRRRDWDSLSMRGTQSDTVEFEDVFVPEASVIKLPLNLLFELEYELGLCACYVGVAEAAYRYARELAKPAIARIVESAVGHGHPDAGRLFSAVGDMRLALEPAWLCVMRAAQAGPVGSFPRGLALAQAKHVVGETAVRVTAQAMRVAGPRGLSAEYPVQRLFRDAQAAVLLGITPSDAGYLAGRFELGIAPPGIIIDPSQMR